MHTRRDLRWLIVGANIAAVTASVPIYGQKQAWRRMLEASEAEQITWIKSDLDRGMPVVDPDAGVLTMLVLNRSEVTLPLIEQKIEEVLRSPSSPDNFTDKSVDPQKFVHFAAVAITEAGNAQSLKELSKLIKIDEKRFGYLVDQTLITARVYRNPFLVAYQGFEIGDPAIDTRIVPWAKLQLNLLDNRPLQQSPGPPDQEAVREIEDQKNRTWWAEAMVNKYGGVPSEAQWERDPLASQLAPAQAASVHDSIISLATEIMEKRPER